MRLPLLGSFLVSAMVLLPLFMPTGGCANYYGKTNKYNYKEKMYLKKGAKFTSCKLSIKFTVNTIS